MSNVFGWINLAFGVLAAVAGIIVLRGVFHGPLSSGRTVRFLTGSLFASLAGLMPLTSQLRPIRQICILSVYCTAAAVIAWLKFDLLGRSRLVFVFCVTAVLYFDLVFVSTGIFRKRPLLTTPIQQPLSPFRLVQILFAAAFVVLGILAVRTSRTRKAGGAALGDLDTHIDCATPTATRSEKTLECKALLNSYRAEPAAAWVTFQPKSSVNGGDRNA